MSFKIASLHNQGFVTVPTMFADWIAQYLNGDKRDDINEDLADFSLIEISFNCDEPIPEIVKRLTNAEIPYHFCWFIMEDTEVNYWYLLNKDNTSLIGTNPADKYVPIKPDLAYFNRHMEMIEAQYRLVGNDIGALLDAREIKNYDFEQ